MDKKETLVNFQNGDDNVFPQTREKPIQLRLRVNLYVRAVLMNLIASLIVDGDARKEFTKKLPCVSPVLVIL